MIKILGAMSGSSLDGVDLAIITFSNDQWNFSKVDTIPYPSLWIEKLTTYDNLSALELIRLEKNYSIFIGEIILDFLDGQNIDYISFHGHTIYHLPKEGITKQLGNGGIISSIAKKDCLTDFRGQDIALGGVGTPLAPIVEKYLFPNHKYYLNLGGIANISIHDEDSILAFDICPLNQVFNFLSKKLGYPYDDKGNISRKGKYVQALCTQLDSLNYFKIAGPKSLDNNWIRTTILPIFDKIKPEDALHTYCIWSAKHIASYMDSKDSSVLITGGGAYNSFFVEILQNHLQKNSVTAIIPNDEIIEYKESLLMAFLAKLYIENRENVLCTVTGASQNTIGGSLYKYVIP